MEAQTAELSLDIQAYHSIQADIAKLEIRKSEIAKSVIKNECPYKIGDCVEYAVWWNKGKINKGIIKRIYFNGFSSDAIDNKWQIEVLPTNNDFKEKNRVVVHSVLLGERGDKINLIK